MTPAQRAIVEMEEAKRNHRRCVFTSPASIDAVVDAVKIGWCQLVPEGEGDHVIEETSITGKKRDRTGIKVQTPGEDEVRRLQSAA